FFVHFDGYRMHTVPLPKETAESRVMALAQGPDGTLFGGTDGAGLLQVKEGQGGMAAGWPLASARNVRALLTLPDGSLLVGLRNGLLRGVRGAWSAVPLPFTASVSTLARATDGTLWIGTYGDGLIELPAHGRARI